ncbi:RNA methyltransferase [uncultured Secundilactobacillus sp.]|uniref:TrmH family RNA methyltransferase n=1 Tax=uncultured Secundilactobacillus sp. TaxID=2813935 RepID=UPI00258D9319|nr:RNA methyltransferase [uncultured Secundilactobacillus sp.]
MREKITSTQNARVKRWQHLTTKKGHQKYQAYLIEGWHTVGDAIQAGRPLTAIIGTDEQLTNHGAVLPGSVDQFEVSDDIVKKLSDTVTPQGIFAVVTISETATVTPEKATGGWLLLDHVADPGNIGTMVRTADAAGFSGVVFGHGTSSQYNPKVIRAMQGSQFHISLVAGDLGDWIARFKERELAVYGSALNPAAKDYRTVSPTTTFAIIMGNEGQGMTADLLAETTANLYIPIKGQAESLNVGVAAGVLMFQLNSYLLD